MHPTDHTKAALRTSMRATLDAIPAVRWAEASRRLCENVGKMPVFQRAKAVFAFVPIAGEVDITPLLRLCLERGQTLCLPRIDWTTRTMVPAAVTSLDDASLETTRYSIRQPKVACPVVPNDQLDLVLVPGLAFAKVADPEAIGQFVRLGRGAGFYDRFFESAPSLAVGPTLGIALSEQILPSIPADPWDIAVRAVATPDEVFGNV